MLIARCYDTVELHEKRGTCNEMLVSSFQPIYDPGSWHHAINADEGRLFVYIRWRYACIRGRNENSVE